MGPKHMGSRPWPF